ncbi:hypothetical protein [uncultured Sutterella sp.]|uniref:hypothetical protein n=1 Tax=uncultured Sutterella sp. TaxID=286133 RepID=UPI0025ECDB54|nr:hypothetical protein [uncultured Sutterella sp.]
MHWSLLDSTAVILLTLHALLKGMETRLVLLSSGCSLALIAGEPLAAFRAFDRSMTLGGLIIGICTAMGCERHFADLLIRPLAGTGVFLLPARSPYGPRCSGRRTAAGSEPGAPVLSLLPPVRLLI